MKSFQILINNTYDDGSTEQGWLWYNQSLATDKICMYLVPEQRHATTFSHEDSEAPIDVPLTMCAMNMVVVKHYV